MNLVSKDASPVERLDAIFLHISSFENSTPLKYGMNGKRVDLVNSFMVKDPSFFGLEAKEEMKFYLNQLFEDGLLILEDHRNATTQGRFSNVVIFPHYGVITFKGSQYLHNVEKRSPLSSKCFVAMAFDEKKNERMNAIRKSCEAFGYTAFTIDEHNELGNHTIDAKIILAIKGSRFCIVDFTGVNAGAYMEAGYAMGRDKKVIFVCEETDFSENKKHFDVNHYPFLKYSSFEHLTEQLTSEIGVYIDIEKLAVKD
jgi:nucleoside 2-deoxyribosyltransferase